MIKKTTRKPQTDEVIGQIVNVISDEDGINATVKLNEGMLFPDFDIVICKTCGDKWDDWHQENAGRISWWAHWQRNRQLKKLNKWFDKFDLKHNHHAVSFEDKPDA